ALDAVRVERQPGLASGERTVRRRDLLAADGGADLAPERADAVGRDVELRSEALGLSAILGESLLALESTDSLDPGVDLVFVERAPRAASTGTRWPHVLGECACPRCLPESARGPAGPVAGTGPGARD